jgi:hypothetical protein
MIELLGVFIGGVISGIGLVVLLDILLGPDPPNPACPTCPERILG